MVLAALILAILGQSALSDKTLVEYKPSGPCQVRSVFTRFSGKPGNVVIHFWKDIGSSVHPYLPYAHFEFDLVSPVQVQVNRASLGAWTKIPLKQPIELRNGERLFIGGWFGPTGPVFASDVHGLPTYREIRPAPKTTKPPEIEEPPFSAVRVSAQKVAPDSAIRFRNVTAQTGLRGISGQRFAWGDVDGDGFEDLLVDGHRLFLNRAGRRFEEAHPFSQGAPNVDVGIFADVDRDGDLDLFTASEFASSPATIWLNDGHGHFTPMAAIPKLQTWTYAACWFDANGDGYPDLYIGNGWNSDRSQPNAPDRLWLNQKGKGFIDVGSSFGIDPRPADARFTRATVAADFDGDGVAEVLAGTFRLEPDRLWKFHQRRAGDLAARLGFTRIPGLLGQPTEGNAIGATAADIDGDGSLDLFVSNLVHPDWRGWRFSSESTIFFGRPGLRFRRQNARDVGISYDETPANPVFADFDLDGDPDLIVNSAYHRARFFENRGGRFVERTLEAGISGGEGIGLAVADFNHDGLLDVVLQEKGRLVLFENVSHPKRWAGLRYDRASRLGQTATLTRGASKVAIPLLAGFGTGNQNGFMIPFAFTGQRPIRVILHGGKTVLLSAQKYGDIP